MAPAKHLAVRVSRFGYREVVAEHDWLYDAQHDVVYRNGGLYEQGIEYETFLVYKRWTVHDIDEIVNRMGAYLKTTDGKWCGCYEGDMDYSFPDAVQDALATLRAILEERE